MLLSEASDCQGAGRFIRRTLHAGAGCSQTNGTTKSEPRRTDTHTTQPSAGAKIAKFYVDEAAPGSGYETGPLHIVYSDGTHIIQRLPPLEKSTDKNIVFNAVGFSEVQLADDGQTLGWAIQVENCCTSYSIPLSVVVFRSGKVLHTFNSGPTVWNWMFLHEGKQLAVVRAHTWTGSRGLPALRGKVGQTCV